METKLLNNFKDETILKQNTYNNFRKNFVATFSDYMDYIKGQIRHYASSMEFRDFILKQYRTCFFLGRILNTIFLIKTVIPSFILNRAELFDEFTIIKTNLLKN